MFDFPDISKLDPLSLLDATVAAKEYWSFLWSLKKLWNGFGNRAHQLLNVYKPFAKQADLINDLATAMDWSELKIEDIINELKRVDDWLMKSGQATGSDRLPVDAMSQRHAKYQD